MENLLKKKPLLIFGAIGFLIILTAVSFFIFNSNNNNEAEISEVKVSTQSSSPSSNQPSNESSNVTWTFDGNTWSANSTAPSCSTPILSTLPVDIGLVTAILYPGQTRGGNYKPHGGFRFADTTNSITVTAPLEGSVVSASRYLEQDEIQYLFTIVNSCGIAYRFDHLLTLSEKFQKIADTLPAAQKDDSRTTRIEPPIKVEKGNVVATAVGFSKTKNVSVDFGVYDLRSPNEASKNPTFATNQAQFKEFAFFGICWLDHYPSEISTKLKSLPAGDAQNGKTSDYCK